MEPVPRVLPGTNGVVHDWGVSMYFASVTPENLAEVNRIKSLENDREFEALSYLGLVADMSLDSRNCPQGCKLSGPQFNFAMSDFVQGKVNGIWAAEVIGLEDDGMFVESPQDEDGGDPIHFSDVGKGYAACAKAYTNLPGNEEECSFVMVQRVRLVRDEEFRKRGSPHANVLYTRVHRRASEIEMRTWLYDPNGRPYKGRRRRDVDDMIGAYMEMLLVCMRDEFHGERVNMIRLGAHPRRGIQKYGHFDSQQMAAASAAAAARLGGGFCATYSYIFMAISMFFGYTEPWKFDTGFVATFFRIRQLDIQSMSDLQRLMVNGLNALARVVSYNVTVKTMEHDPIVFCCSVSGGESFHF